MGELVTIRVARALAVEDDLFADGGGSVEACVGRRRAVAGREYDAVGCHGHTIADDEPHRVRAAAVRHKTRVIELGFSSGVRSAGLASDRP